MNTLRGDGGAADAPAAGEALATGEEQSSREGSTPSTPPFDVVIDRHVIDSGQSHLFESACAAYSTGTKRMMRLGIKPVILAAAQCASLAGMLKVLRERGELPEELMEALIQCQKEVD